MRCQLWSGILTGCSGRLSLQSGSTGIMELYRKHNSHAQFTASYNIMAMGRMWRGKWTHGIVTLLCFFFQVTDWYKEDLGWMLFYLLAGCCCHWANLYWSQHRAGFLLLGRKQLYNGCILRHIYLTSSLGRTADTSGFIWWPLDYLLLFVWTGSGSLPLHLFNYYGHAFFEVMSLSSWMHSKWRSVGLKIK